MADTDPPVELPIAQIPDHECSESDSTTKVWSNGITKTTEHTCNICGQVWTLSEPETFT